MSRAYSMALTVRGLDSRKQRLVQKAAEQEWPFDDWHLQRLEDTTILTASGDDNLCGGESEEDFADRLARAIWAAHGVYCEVEVSATFLDELPYETHTRGEACYTENIHSKPRPKKPINREAATGAAEEEPCASPAEPCTKP